jgi:hypothetical protein
MPHLEFIHTSPLLRIPFSKTLGDRYSISTLNAAITSKTYRGSTSSLMNASRVFVISLPQRNDRRVDMEKLRVHLDVQWTYLAAADPEDEPISRVMARVKSRRKQLALNATFPTQDDVSRRYLDEQIRWPWSIGNLSGSMVPLNLSGSDTWSIETPPSYFVSESQSSDAFPLDPLTCSVYNAHIPYPIAGLPDYKILTSAKVACWHSHLYAIRAIADGSPGEFGIILEDDVDLESDIIRRLESAWRSLPPQWDMVFLGAPSFRRTSRSYDI